MLYSNMAKAVVKDVLGSVGSVRVIKDAIAGSANSGRGVCRDEGNDVEEKDAVRCNRCLVVHLDTRSVRRPHRQ